MKRELVPAEMTEAEGCLLAFVSYQNNMPTLLRISTCQALNSVGFDIGLNLSLLLV